MMASDVWGERWSNSTSEIARRYMEVACRKQSLVCLAADRNTMAGLFDLIESVGPHIAALKTHVDLVDDWNKESWSKFRKCWPDPAGPSPAHRRQPGAQTFEFSNENFKFLKKMFKF